MKKTSVARFLLLPLAVLAFAASPFPAHAQRPHDEARELVAHVQGDLRRVSHFASPTPKERERYDNARRHLSEFDRRLRQGDFDKDKLDTAIDDVKNVAENNNLQPRDRDLLNDDLRDLRQMRANRGR
jgi:hypothetical protein